MLKTNLTTLLRVHKRLFNCWTAGITKKHRAIYERTDFVSLVLSDGSGIRIRYQEPLSIIRLPLNLKALSEEERLAILEKRKPKTKVKMEDEFDDDFDEGKYLKK